mgnify:CR=1 FL=1
MNRLRNFDSNNTTKTSLTISNYTKSSVERKIALPSAIIEMLENYKDNEIKNRQYRRNTPALIFETIPKQEQPLFLESVTNFIEENFDGFLTDEDLTDDKKMKLSDEGTFYKVHALMNLLHNFNVMVTREEAEDSQEEVTEETTKFIPKYTTIEEYASSNIGLYIRINRLIVDLIDQIM